MPDEIDRLVDQETMLEAQALANRPRMSDEDKALLDQGAMTKDAARELTEQIKATATATYVLIHRAHELKCWVSLGYKTWEDYVINEFDMSKSRSYQLINQAKVVEAIQEVVPDGTEVLLTEAQARDVEKALPRITDKLKEKTKDQSPDEASQTVKDVVNDVRNEEKENKNRTENDGVSLLDGDDLDKEASKKELKSDSDGGTGGKPKGGVAPIDNDKMLQSTGDDDDFDDDLDDDFDEFGHGSALQIGYIFACVDGLGDADEAAAQIDEPEKNLADTKKTISWMQKFQEALEKRINEENAAK